MWMLKLIPDLSFDYDYFIFDMMTPLDGSHDLSSIFMYKKCYFDKLFVSEVVKMISSTFDASFCYNDVSISVSQCLVFLCVIILLHLIWK